MQDDFRPDDILRVLQAHKVEFVVIGGLAAIAHGSPLPTFDVDVTPKHEAANLARLSDALRELNAAVRAMQVDQPVPFSHNAATLGERIWNLTTSYGDLDITFIPAGTSGYPDLISDAVDASLGTLTIKVASLADVIRSKEAAGRDKDRRALPALREILARRAV